MVIPMRKYPLPNSKEKRIIEEYIILSRMRDYEYLYEKHWDRDMLFISFASNFLEESGSKMVERVYFVFSNIILDKEYESRDSYSVTEDPKIREYGWINILEDYYRNVYPKKVMEHLEMVHRQTPGYGKSWTTWRWHNEE